jgi:hypothetical protein
MFATTTETKPLYTKGRRSKQLISSVNIVLRKAIAEKGLQLDQIKTALVQADL